MFITSSAKRILEVRGCPNQCSGEKQNKNERALVVQRFDIVAEYIVARVCAPVNEVPISRTTYESKEGIVCTKYGFLVCGSDQGGPQDKAARGPRVAAALPYEDGGYDNQWMLAWVASTVSKNAAASRELRPKNKLTRDTKQKREVKRFS